MGHDGRVTDDIGSAPEPKTDPDVERAPGGVDATSEESDVGSGDAEGELLTPDQPLNAQHDTGAVPDEITEPEESDQAPDENAEDGGTEETD